MSSKKPAKVTSSTKNNNAQRKVTIETFNAVQKLTTLKTASSGSLSSVGEKLQAALGKKANKAKPTVPPAIPPSLPKPPARDHVPSSPPQGESDDNTALQRRIRELEALLASSGTSSSSPPKGLVKPIARPPGEAGRSGKGKKPGFPLIVGMGLDKTEADCQAYDRIMGRIGHILSAHGIEPDSYLRGASAIKVAAVIADLEKEFPDHINAERYNPPYWPVYEFIKIKTRGKRAYRNQIIKAQAQGGRRKKGNRRRKASPVPSSAASDRDSPPPKEASPDINAIATTSTTTTNNNNNITPPEDDDDFYVPDDSDGAGTKPPEAAPVDNTTHPFNEINIAPADVDTVLSNNTDPPPPLDDYEANIRQALPPDEEEEEYEEVLITHEQMLTKPEMLSQLRRLGPVIGPDLVRQPHPEPWPPYLPTDPLSWVNHDKALERFMLESRGTLTDPSWRHRFLSRRFAGDDDAFQAWWTSVWQDRLGLDSEPDVTEPESKPSKRAPPLSSSSSSSSVDSAMSKKARTDATPSGKLLPPKPQPTGAAALISATPKARFPYSRNAGFDLGSPLSSAEESEAEYQPSSPRAISKSAALKRHATRSRVKVSN